MLTPLVASENQHPDSPHLLLRSKLELAIAIWTQGNRNASFAASANAKEMVRLLREVVAYNGTPDASSDADRNEAASYLSTLKQSR